MSRAHAVIVEDGLRVPSSAFTFAGFQRWLTAPDFPESGRIDYLAGDVEVDMSPEDVQTHAVVKAALARTLQEVVSEAERGEVYVDSTRVSSVWAGLSTEPDVVVALWDSFTSGRLRYVTGGAPGRTSAIEGSPDLIVEIVSDSSVKKDTERLPRLYAKAQVPELWLIDARGEKLSFRVYTLKEGAYAAVKPSVGGWVRSPRLGSSFRLLRFPTPVSTWRYVLKHK